MKQIAERLKSLGIKAYWVGGYVRDKILGIESEDRDVCIEGSTPLQFTQILETFKKEELIKCFTSVKGNFPIWIVELDDEKIEFALTRTERKTGETHQDFICNAEKVSIEEDLFRRDLTINALAEDILTGEIIDPYGGRMDLSPHNRPFGKRGIASPVSKAFKEDPLRVIRAARFIARFDLEPSGKLIHYCRELSPDNISKERIGMELKKLFSKPAKNEKFFNFLHTVGWLSKVFPEVYRLMNVPQDPIHHPEGDVYSHTMHCINACKSDDWFMKTVMLCHDMGKPDTTTVNNIPWSKGLGLTGKISAINHENVGAEICKEFLKRISFIKHIHINRIALLVQLHMFHTVMNEKNKEKIIRRTLRKLIDKSLSYYTLCEVVRCDKSGRPPKPVIDHIDLGQSIADDLVLSGKMDPIVNGKLLIEAGVTNQIAMSRIIDFALELQDRCVLNSNNWKKVLKSQFKEEIPC